MDVDEAFSTVENSLRDVIERVLHSKHGTDWLSSAGVTHEKLQKWGERRDEERKRRPGVQVEDRLLYFANFEDLADIVRRNWDQGFFDCFGNLARFKAYAERLVSLRNPDAHSRPLRPFEEHLVLGISGEIRQQVTIYFSSGGPSDEPEHFARIEEIVDNYGLRARGGASSSLMTQSPVTLRPGDVVTFRARAWDPHGDEIKWRVHVNSRDGETRLKGSEIVFEWSVEEADIGESREVAFDIDSPRPYSRRGGADDTAWIFYRVLPRVGTGKPGELDP